MSNEFEVEIPGVVGRVTLTRPGAFSGSELRVDGHPAPKGDKRGTFELPAEGGRKKIARLRQHISWVLPAVEVDDVKHEVGPKIPFGLMLLACIPFALGGVGGMIGGAMGGAAFAINMGIARSTLPVVSQALAMVAVTVAVSIGFFFIAGLIGLASHP